MRGSAHPEGLEEREEATYIFLDQTLQLSPLHAERSAFFSRSSASLTQAREERKDKHISSYVSSYYLFPGVLADLSVGRAFSSSLLPALHDLRGEKTFLCSHASITPHT